MFLASGLNHTALVLGALFETTSWWWIWVLHEASPTKLRVLAPCAKSLWFTALLVAAFEIPTMGGS
jgi:hypothetical protein